jgi:hypothetical protein
MLVAPRHGFVFLASPKTGTSAIEQAFAPYVQLASQGHRRIKHTPPERFEKFLVPYLEDCGFRRKRYEVVSVVREPIDLLRSWWRYRSRGKLKRPRHKYHHRYTGDMTFAEFGEVVLAGRGDLSRPSKFLTRDDGSLGVDRLFRYDDLGDLHAWFCERVGEDVPALERVNTSPPREADELDDGMVARLREYLADDYHLYDLAEGHQRLT